MPRFNSGDEHDILFNGDINYIRITSDMLWSYILVPAPSLKYKKKTNFHDSRLFFSGFTTVNVIKK